MSKSDTRLKQDIQDELGWDPKVNAAQIGVTVDRGVVTLLGAVSTFAEKWAAEAATKRVAGVRTVAESLTVKVPSDHARTDSEIAMATQSALRWDVFVPASVTAKVQQAIVTLEGEVRWNYQREAAVRAIRQLPGVAHVHNAISITPSTSASEVKILIQAALQRQASADTSTILVAIEGSIVTLSGTAASWQSIEDATIAAWSAPGVTNVIDQVKMAMTF